MKKLLHLSLCILLAQIVNLILKKMDYYFLVKATQGCSPISFRGSKSPQQRMKNNSIQLLYCFKTIEKNFYFFKNKPVFFSTI